MFQQRSDLQLPTMLRLEEAHVTELWRAACAQDPSLHGGSSYGEFSNKASSLASGPAPTVRYSGVLRRKPSAWDLEQAERTVSRGRRCAKWFE